MKCAFGLSADEYFFWLKWCDVFSPCRWQIYSLDYQVYFLFIYFLYLYVVGAQVGGRQEAHDKLT